MRGVHYEIPEVKIYMEVTGFGCYHELLEWKQKYGILRY